MFVVDGRVLAFGAVGLLALASFKSSGSRADGTGVTSDKVVVEVVGNRVRSEEFVEQQLPSSHDALYWAKAWARLVVQHRVHRCVTIRVNGSEIATFGECPRTDRRHT